MKRRDRRQGLILVNTGDGKGKSSSAFGMVFRAAAWGMRVCVIQFIKGQWLQMEGRPRGPPGCKESRKKRLPVRDRLRVRNRS